MSVQFGQWNLDGKQLEPDYLVKVEEMLRLYGPDSSSSYSQGGVNILYHAFHTTKESRQEAQPVILKSGTVITWDGRLDNRAEFISLLHDRLLPGSADSAIVAAAYERWGTKCLSRFVGDWAMSIWDPNDRALTLAEDFIGTRHLYYSADFYRVTWSTVLDPLVLLAGRSFLLEEEYVAGWLGMFPAAHLTPYVGISSVPPSCLVRLEKGRTTITKYWDFNPAKQIRYRNDSEYEEHFRTMFRQSVQRRLRCDTPVLAELSGGLDSSSIVCVADALLSQGAANSARLDTLSYYDDSEPNWNERPYFTKVENKRGRTGHHINTGSQSTLNFGSLTGFAAATPGTVGLQGPSATQVAALMTSGGYRVVLSGIGGDEVTGGVPTPIPELADLLATARFVTLARQLKVWALNKRKPWIHVLIATVRGFLNPNMFGEAKRALPARFLRTEFVGRHCAALLGYPAGIRVFGPRPSFQENISTLDGLRRQLACTVLRVSPPYEKRYPYLDRDLLEFLYAVPRAQVLRPGHRRSLMRRALVGVVPEEILNRRRKAFVFHTPLEAISRESPNLLRMSRDMASVSLGIVDEQKLVKILEGIRLAQEIPITPLMRLLALEFWLKSCLNGAILDRRQSLPHLRRVRSKSCRSESAAYISLAS